MQNRKHIYQVIVSFVFCPVGSLLTYHYTKQLNKNLGHQATDRLMNNYKDIVYQASNNKNQGLASSYYYLFFPPSNTILKS